MSKTSEPHPILKNGGDNHENHPHITWDEEVIAEHDKDRGTRQKINEPNTPYRYGDNDSDSDLEDETNENQLSENWNELQQKLNDHQEIQDEHGFKNWEDHLNDNDNEEVEEESHRKEFEAKRAAHYNEFQMLRAWRQSHTDDDDDDDEDGNNNNDNMDEDP